MNDSSLGDLDPKDRDQELPVTTAPGRGSSHMLAANLQIARPKSLVTMLDAVPSVFAASATLEPPTSSNRPPHLLNPRRALQTRHGRSSYPPYEADISTLLAEITLHCSWRREHALSSRSSITCSSSSHRPLDPLPANNKTTRSLLGYRYTPDACHFRAPPGLSRPNPVGSSDHPPILQQLRHDS